MKMLYGDSQLSASLFHSLLPTVPSLLPSLSPVAKDRVFRGAG
jgi:hypothetical protein